jgi:hypothetical protein
MCPYLSCISAIGDLHECKISNKEVKDSERKSKCLTSAYTNCATYKKK